MSVCLVGRCEMMDVEPINMQGKAVQDIRLFWLIE